MNNNTSLDYFLIKIIDIHTDYFIAFISDYSQIHEDSCHIAS
jgi:hypothetical protein